MILLFDNYDSFTYNLWDYIERCGVKCKVLRNDVPLTKIKSYSFDGIVLSPGFGKPKNAGVMMEVIDFYHKDLPILGVCLGYQALGEYFGAKLTFAPQPMHGKISKIICQKDELFEDLPSEFEIVRYHSLILKFEANLPVYPTAYLQKKAIPMALSHKSLPIKGVQFHPEAALSQYGLEIIKNWVRLTQKHFSL